MRRKVSISRETNRVYDQLIDYVKLHKFAPTRKELAEETSLTVNQVNRSLKELEGNGYVVLKSKSPRAISVCALKVN